ncbi:MAG TPA: UDP-N-acetylglucosamine 1-carboxyvinyltransferase [Clostridiaceae bacterium]|nr:UDP-N-acetylglucosamine 1-carboxyvinyltransferase [Clostridiaceae bacterium]
MSKMVIHGGQKLKGEVQVEGSKNAVLPILTATLLNSGISVIKNCPRLRDVDVTLKILTKLGCKVKFEGDTVIIDSSTINSTDIPVDLATEMRSSIIFVGPMLSRCKKVKISFPGGCEIGPRPIDLHIKALRSMGAKILDIQGGIIYFNADRLVGTDIHLSYPSVGATENAMLASVFAEGETYIHNAAKEPEIIDLQNFLRAMGAKVTGAGTGVIHVEGVGRKLNDVEYTIMPDRIVAGTYMIATAMTGGETVIKNIIPEYISSITSILIEAGSDISISRNELKISGPKRNKAIDIVRTLPYPGFPTDMQAPLVSLLSIADGTSIVIETVFENRFKHVDELMKMGANITVEGRIAVIRGVNKLHGATIYARDLRGAASLVLAGLVAEGETIVENIYHLDRGYERMDAKLTQLGAMIQRKD